MVDQIYLFSYFFPWTSSKGHKGSTPNNASDIINDVRSCEDSIPLFSIQRLKNAIHSDHQEMQPPKHRSLCVSSCVTSTWYQRHKFYTQMFQILLLAFCSSQSLSNADLCALPHSTKLQHRAFFPRSYQNVINCGRKPQSLKPRAGYSAPLDSLNTQNRARDFIFLL